MSLRAIVVNTPITGDPREIVAHSRARLKAMRDDLAPSDGRIMIEVFNSTDSTMAYGEDIELFIDAGLDFCDEVEAALDAEDAPAAAMAMMNLADVSHHLVMAGMMKEIFVGRNRIRQQREFRLIKAEEDRQKHDQWRQWQTDLHMAKASKRHQARILKERHNIKEGIQAISKQLEPRPKK